MPIDVRFLRDFYATRLGQAAAQDILRVLREMDLPAAAKPCAWVTACRFWMI